MGETAGSLDRRFILDLQTDRSYNPFMYTTTKINLIYIQI